MRLSNRFKTLSLLCILTSLAGCSNIISATREEPIREDQGNRTIGTYIEDEVIENKVLVNLSKAKDSIKNAHIGVTSFDTVLLITGQVSSEVDKYEVEQIAKQTRKITKIHNELQISGPTSAIVRANDVYLTSRVKVQLFATENIQSDRIKVVTENSITYLMGLVTPQEAERAVNVVRSVPGINKIVKVFEYIPYRS